MDLLLAADFLGIKELSELACASLAKIRAAEELRGNAKLERESERD